MSIVEKLSISVVGVKRKVAKIVHCGLAAANELTRLEETQHFYCWG